MSNLQPAELLSSEEVMSPLKRKASVERLVPGSPKRLRLDPNPTEGDSTMMDNNEREQVLLPEDRDNPYDSMLFGEELEECERTLERIEESLRRRVGTLGQKTEHINQKLNNLQQKTDEIAKQFYSFQQWDKGQQERRLISLMANALIDLARFVAKKLQPGSTVDHSPSQLQQFILSIIDTQLSEMDIPPKIWPLLRRFDEVYPDPIPSPQSYPLTNFTKHQFLPKRTSAIRAPYHTYEFHEPEATQTQGRTSSRPPLRQLRRHPHA